MWADGELRGRYSGTAGEGKVVIVLTVYCVWTLSKGFMLVTY